MGSNDIVGTSGLALLDCMDDGKRWTARSLTEWSGVPSGCTTANLNRLHRKGLVAKAGFLRQHLEGDCRAQTRQLWVINLGGLRRLAQERERGRI